MDNFLYSAVCQDTYTWWHDLVPVSGRRSQTAPSFGYQWQGAVVVDLGIVREDAAPAWWPGGFDCDDLAFRGAPTPDPGACPGCVGRAIVTVKQDAIPGV